MSVYPRYYYLEVRYSHVPVCYQASFQLWEQCHAKTSRIPIVYDAYRRKCANGVSTTSTKATITEDIVSNPTLTGFVYWTGSAILSNSEIRIYFPNIQID